MYSNTDDQINKFQTAVGRQGSNARIVQLRNWQNASTKGGTNPTPAGVNGPSRDLLVIGAIIIGGFGWYYWRRKHHQSVEPKL
jgi:LPXTG-motif cell wall-anchored protein